MISQLQNKAKPPCKSHSLCCLCASDTLYDSAPAVIFLQVLYVASVSRGIYLKAFLYGWSSKYGGVVCHILHFAEGKARPSQAYGHNILHTLQLSKESPLCGNRKGKLNVTISSEDRFPHSGHMKADEGRSETSKCPRTIDSPKAKSCKGIDKFKRGNDLMKGHLGQAQILGQVPNPVVVIENQRNPCENSDPRKRISLRLR